MTRKFPVLILAAATAALVLATATAAGATANGAANPDGKWVMEAAAGGMMEVEMGKMAVAKASSADVKQFGQRMIDDHSKANEELKQIATGKAIKLPDGIDASHKAKMDKMSKLSGAAFDRAYMADMVEDHEKDVPAFQKEAASGKDPDFKAFAAKTVPTLEEHLKMAKEVNAKVGGSK